MFEQMKKEHARLSARIPQLEHAIEQLPEGSLGWCKRGENYRYYCLTDTKHFLSRRNDRAFIEELAKKKYLQKLLTDAKYELAAIKKYLKNHKEQSLAEKLLTENIHIADILSPFFRSADQELAEWSASDYPSTAAHPEQLIFPCIVPRAADKPNLFPPFFSGWPQLADTAFVQKTMFVWLNPGRGQRFCRFSIKLAGTFFSLRSAPTAASSAKNKKPYN